ncbi:tocopherol cyclase family protein [Vallitalea okinawensis]|uniref:tocopherol cyclase family protein n=1 Tax=Vallitalea okinawensis TaxID=2078660 RepID=UPI000CFD1D98|nr:tocopherol cyclase family protein [Vallitalea okinawensis]
MRKPYFTGWYFRATDLETNYSLSIIVGTHYSIEKHSSFIQIIDTTEKKTYYISYPSHYLKLNVNPFYIKCGKSIFTKDFMYLNIDTPRIQLHGLLTFDDLLDIKRTVTSPTIMGPFSFFNFMECYHHILSLHHFVNGVVTLNGKKHFFNQASGYIEADSGTSFPKDYVWLQCNTFNTNDIKFMCSFAHIPFLITSFNGLICVLNINGKEHRFATYNGSHVERYLINSSKVYMIIRKKHYRLVIKAHLKNGRSLISPQLGTMNRPVIEDLEGQISIQFFKNNALLFEDLGELCAIEISHKY